MEYISYICYNIVLMSELVHVTDRVIPEVFNVPDSYHTRYLLDRRLQETYQEKIPGFVLRRAGVEYAPQDLRPTRLSGETLDLGHCTSLTKLSIPGDSRDSGTHVDAEAYGEMYQGLKDIFVHYENSGYVRVEMSLLAAGYDNPHRMLGRNPDLDTLYAAFDSDQCDPAMLEPVRYSATLGPEDALIFSPTRSLHRFTTVAKPEFGTPPRLAEEYPLHASRVSLVAIHLVPRDQQTNTAA